MAAPLNPHPFAESDKKLFKMLKNGIYKKSVCMYACLKLFFLKIAHKSTLGPLHTLLTIFNAKINI